MKNRGVIVTTHNLENFVNIYILFSPHTITAYIQSEPGVQTGKAMITQPFKPRFKLLFSLHLKLSCRSADDTTYRRAKHGLQKALHRAKWDFKCKLESHFQSGKSRAAWHGLQTVTDYRKTILPTTVDAALSDRLSFTVDLTGTMPHQWQPKLLQSHYQVPLW